MAQHQDLASGRWFEMTLAEQLGNVGSEYGRALNWLHRDPKRFQLALMRYLELLDLTINDPRWNVFRKKELLRLREASCEGFIDNTKPDFQKYFYQFALLARSKK